MNMRWLLRNVQMISTWHVLDLDCVMNFDGKFRVSSELHLIMKLALFSLFRYKTADFNFARANDAVTITRLHRWNGGKRSWQVGRLSTVWGVVLSSSLVPHFVASSLCTMLQRKSRHTARRWSAQKSTAAHSIPAQMKVNKEEIFFDFGGFFFF